MSAENPSHRLRSDKAGRLDRSPPEAGEIAGSTGTGTVIADQRDPVAQKRRSQFARSTKFELFSDYLEKMNGSGPGKTPTSS
jgi:hypothetical protein